MLNAKGIIYKNNILMKKNIIVHCFLLAMLAACSDKESMGALEEDGNGVLMTAHDFDSGETYNRATRSTLTPSSGGTVFKWDEGDVASVYSSGKGLTNFFIDESTISSDGTSAKFNGSGFVLSPDSKYYAFYPYSASALDKCNIPIRYTGQNMNHNGAFKELGNYDYMYASGVTNTSGNVSFDFKHIGCVVEFLLQAPETAVYSQVRFELEGSTKELSFIKSGNADITSTNQCFVADNTLSSDTIMRVDLNKGTGFAVQKDSLLKIYMMAAPQDLSGKNIVVRLVDSNSKWYSAKVSGKNMKSGHTYHYNITDDSEFGGFTGKGHGLPDDYTYRFISSYKDPNIKSYEDLVVDGSMLYAVGAFGVRKINYDDEKNPVLEKTTDAGVSGMRFRSIAECGDNLYISVRQGSSGAQETIVPELRLNFETHASEYSSELSDNEIVNAFFKHLSIQSGSIEDVVCMYLYKAYKKSANEYRNSIYIKMSNGSVSFIGNSYATRSEALNHLESTFKTINGDECVVDWDALPEGGNVVRNIKMNNMGQFDSYMSKGSAKIDEKGDASPNTGLYSARLMTGNVSQSENVAVLTRSLEKKHTSGDLTFWVKKSCSTCDEIEIPLLSGDSQEKLSFILQPSTNGKYGAVLKVGGNVHTLNLSLGDNEWYNIKLSVHTDKISMFVRSKEAGKWNVVGEYAETVSFDAVNVGIKTSSSNALVYVDDVYFNPTDIDKVSYVNGKLLVLDKSDLSVINSYNLDLKGTEIRVYGNTLIVSLLRGFNIYDITDPSNPILTFTKRYSGYKECQGIDIYESDGRVYAFICNYSEGFTIVDITDVKQPDVVTVNDAPVVFNGISLKNKSYNFDVVVDYPYAYLTHCSSRPYIGTDMDYRGVYAINITSAGNMESELITVPKEDLYNKMTGDQCPISIDKYGNTLFIDNGAKGILSFDISDKSRPKYVRSIATGENSQVGTIRTTQDGRIFISENGSDCSLKLYRAE